ncbi:MAG TPA: NAD(+) synthase [Candidatus Paceibacterota bacterium]|nr:NAD(+) synthase [Verrucomicrobiota bacterium]HSA09136.1 NAD(+) synthase [Candidatus Paceibacterota bacterium]
MKAPEQRIKLARMDASQVADEIGGFILRKVLEMKKTGGVLGISGGVDSTCVAALAKRAFDRHNATHPDRPLELVGYLLPSNTNHPADVEDGLKVATRLGIRHEIQSIEAIVEAFKTTNPEALNHKYHRGNLTSEIRAVVLHVKAATENKVVIGTGNKDEDYGVAYYTLFGDGAVHMSPIGNLPKRLVREMAAHLGFEELAGRVSTAGLEPGQTSFKDLGCDYEFAELVLNGLEQGLRLEELAGHSQVVAYARQQMEKYVQWYGAPKFTSIEALVREIIRRHEIALLKAEIVNPDIASITLKLE